LDKSFDFGNEEVVLDQRYLQEDETIVERQGSWEPVEGVCSSIRKFV
jgi:hypothetical protein